MKCTNKTIAIFMAVFIVFCLTAVPNTINFQGALKDADGVPVNDTKYIVFRIYDDPDTGTLLWSEDHSTVVITDGIFSEELGGSDTFPADLFDNPVLYLTFFVGGEEMTPRQKLLSVPYALQSKEIDGVPLSGLIQQDGSGNATIIGTMTADAFVGDGSGLTNISGAYDPIYVNTAGPDTMTANTTLGVLNIENTNSAGKGISILDAAHGVYVNNADTTGIYVNSAGEDGFNVYNAGTPSTQITSSYKHGFEVAGAEGSGLYVGRADWDGVFVRSAGDDGFNVYNAGTPSTQYTNAFKNGFEVDGAEGYGLYVGHADLDGVRIASTVNNGVTVYNAGNPSTQQLGTVSNGFEVAGAEGNGLYVGQADAHGIYVNNADTTGVYVNSAGDDGVYVHSAGGYGINVYSAGDDGVSIYRAGTPSTLQASTGKNGFEVAGAEGYGLFVGHADISGVRVSSAGDDGVYVNGAGDDGVYVYHAGNPSVSYFNYSHDGFAVSGAEGNGLWVGWAEEYGVRVEYAGGHGVYANTTNAIHEYGIYTPDKMYATHGYYPARSGTFGRNTGSGTLEAGDLVCIAGGYEENVLGEDGVPVIKIEKANSRNSEAIFGVVEYKVYIREEVEEFEDGKTEIQKSFRHAEGDVMSGDYLAIIVFGPVDVKIDSRSDIKIGESVVAGDGIARKIRTTEVNGIMMAENIGILGKALEDSNGKGKIKVYVNCK